MRFPFNFIFMARNVSPSRTSFTSTVYFCRGCYFLVNSINHVYVCKPHDVFFQVPNAALNASAAFLLVLSNEIRNVAYKYPVAPPGTSENIWPYRFTTAISITGDSNILVANNLIAKSTRSASVKLKLIAHMEGNDTSVAHTRVRSPPPPSPCTMTTDFPYDNRYGIRHNSNGGITVNVSIVGNWVYQNGRVGVIWYSNDGLGGTRGGNRPGSQGQGVAVMYNHVEVANHTVCWTVEGNALCSVP